MLNTHLFLFTIGPVQSFIAQARKTQDLYAGSRILSVLITQAMKTLQSECASTQFVFPTDINSDAKPNRFTAIVTTDQEDIQLVGHRVKKAVEDYFIGELGKKVLSLRPDSIDQLQDFLKVYWIAHPVQLDAHKEVINYASEIKQAEKLLGATKNIRYFHQLKEKGRKCSLNGEYNVKFYRRTQGEAAHKKNEDIHERKLFHTAANIICPQDTKDIQLKHLQQGEGLCAVSMVKRFFEEDKGEFPSTSVIATMDTLKILREKNPTLGQDIDKLLNKDTQFIYEEAITPSNLKKANQDTADYGNLVKLQKHIADKAKDYNCILSKYYAILVFDADGMGSQLSKCKTAAEHQKLSELLAKYGKEATKYINDNRIGRTVYAGGDDFLGFINLNHLFEAMQTLRVLFDTSVNDELCKANYSHLQLTFSAGVAIAHYKAPLSEVLNYARAMEKKAKKVEHESDDKSKKDAFSIAVLKHSGEIHDTTFRWKANDRCSTTTLKMITSVLKEKKISDKFITNLSKTFAKLLSKDGDWWFDSNKQTAITPAQRNSLNEIFKSELERFVKKAKNEEAKVDVQDFCQALNTLYEDHLPFDLNLQNFLNALHICEFISRHLNKKQSDNLKTETTS